MAMKGGPQPGAGRPKGKPSRKTIERARRAAEDVASGRELSVDALRRYAALFEGAAAIFRPARPGDEANPNGDWAQFGEWADRAVDCHKAILPCETPRLTAIAVANAPQQTATIKRITLKIFEAPPLLLPAPKVEEEGPVIEHEEDAA